jgi:teichuronic acid biosynthesis glycosyltransferase TuaH
MRRRILYVMHVDWRWIKQRPQFLAEAIASTHDVLALYRVNLRRGTFPANRSHVARLPLLPIPSARRRAFAYVDAPAQRAWLAAVTRVFRPDAVWLTHPLLLPYLPSSLNQVPLVYDCMDDALGFADDSRALERIRRLERQLVQRSSILLCSSDHLCTVVTERHAPVDPTKVMIVRNGLSDELLNHTGGGCEAPYAEEGARCSTSRRPIRIAYVGTIAEWLDTHAILHCLDAIDRLEVDLIGPVAVPQVAHSRLRYRGVVDHASLAAEVREYDALVMPFIVTDLVRSVDPVKLYEYLAFGKEVISVRYDGLDRFAPYVHFYQTPEEFVRLLRRLSDGTLPSRNRVASVRPFLARNTWAERARDINVRLAALL